MLAENHTEPVKASLADAVEKIGMSPSVMPKIPTPGALINETNTKRAEELLDALEDSGHDFKISFDATGKPVVEVDGNDDGKFSREQTGRGVLHGIPDLTSHDRSPVGIGAVGPFDTGTLPGTAHEKDKTSFIDGLKNRLEDMYKNHDHRLDLSVNSSVMDGLKDSFTGTQGIKESTADKAADLPQGTIVENDKTPSGPSI